MRDTHIHIMKPLVAPAGLRAAVKTAGLSGGILMSLPPASFPFKAELTSTRDRLDNLMSWTKAANGLFPAGPAGGAETKKRGIPKPGFFPFFWIDPLDADALGQVELALNRNVAGFKVICNRAAPGDSRCLAVFRAIAEAQKPILFHSGILWDGLVSSRFNRPVEFECLLEVPGLRFALAHMSWPWLDECLAVYGKFISALAVNPQVSAEMFIDLTPGTPKIYRREALTKIFTIGYNLDRNILFGTDNRAENYNTDATTECAGNDREIMHSLGVTEEAMTRYFGDNLLRFVG